MGAAKDDLGRLFDGVLLCVCGLSGAVICEPILFNGFTGEKAGKMLLKQWLSAYFVPTEITTDHDAKFTSARFNTLCAGLGIPIAYTEFFRTQTNGRAEVAGHQILQILRKIHAGSTVQGNNPSWVMHLPSVIRAYLQKPGHLALSPHQTLFARDKIGPAPCLPPTPEAACATEWLQEMRDMERLVKILQEKQLKAYEVCYN